MKRSRFSDEQIIGILKEHQAGLSGDGAVPQIRDQRRDVLHLAQEVWRLEVSEAKRLKALEEENARLKKLLAETMMDVSTLREMLAKNF